MAIGDILALKTSLAARLIHALYAITLIIITVMVILGVVRGISIMSRPPMPPPTMSSDAAPADAQGALQQPDMQARRMAMQRFMMERRVRRPGPLGLFGIGRNPTLAGGFLILATLVRGAIMVMVVRILAELGLAVLAMPRRSEA